MPGEPRRSSEQKWKPQQQRVSSSSVEGSTLGTTFSNLTHELAQLSLESQRTRKCFALLVAVFGGMLLTRIIIIPIIVQMLLYTLPIIWFGSHLALNMRVEAEEDETKKDHGGETMTSQNAMAVPFIASFAIFCLYLAFKILPKEWVNLVLSIHVAAAGWYSIGEIVAELWRLMFPLTTDKGPQYTLNFRWGLSYIFGEKLSFKVTTANVMGWMFGAVITVGWLISKAWLLHNLFAVGFSIQAIRLISVGTFKTASILLIGLFFYDIFWVFKTDVMVTVATSFDAPAKLLFPISLDPLKHSLLGLGDIVIPGILTAMTLRFDYWRHKEMCEKKDLAIADKNWRPMFRRFDKFYFTASMIAYAGSLVLTGVVLLVFKRAQPALLYLVPSLLIALYVPAVFRRECSQLTSFNEEEEEEEESTPGEEDDEEEEEEDNDDDVDDRQ